MGPVRALHPTKCVFCPDPIKRGDLIVYAPDDRGWCHEDCERDPGPWDGNPQNTPTLRFHAFMERQGTFTNQLLEGGIDLNELPLEVQRATEKAMLAWGELYSLLEDVASEHREPTIEEQRDYLTDLEQRILEHERKAREGHAHDH